MKAFGSGYDQEMETDWNKVLQRYHQGTGSVEDVMQVEGNWRMRLTYQLLKNDIIEKNGMIEPDIFKGSQDNALEELCRRVIACTSTDTGVVKQTIRDFAGRGYLKADVSGKGCQWSWSFP